MGMMINRRRACGGKKLPYDAEIEYLESSGTQYIDTGTFPYQLVKAELDVQFTSLVKSSILGSAGNGGGNGWYILVGVNTDYTYFWCQWGGMFNGSPDDKDTNRHYHVFEINSDLWSYKIDNMYTSYGPAVAQPPSHSQKMFLFACNNDGALYRQSYARIYSCNIYDANRVLIRSFIPVRVGTTGYMYDKVSGQLFGNAGTGAFILGPDV